MNMNEYQQAAMSTAFYPKDIAGSGLPIYPVLKLAGEAGEVAEKVGKAIRDGIDNHQEFRTMLIKELGDVLWYIAAVANDLAIDLDVVAQMNIQKLKDRANRGVLGGSGDNR